MFEVLRKRVVLATLLGLLLSVLVAQAQDAMTDYVDPCLSPEAMATVAMTAAPDNSDKSVRHHSAEPARRPFVHRLGGGGRGARDCRTGREGQDCRNRRDAGT